MTSALLTLPGGGQNSGFGGLRSVWAWASAPHRTAIIQRWASIIVSVAMVACAAWQLHGFDRAALMTMLPTSPVFWSVLLVAFLATPVLDWVIFCRLWGRVPGGFSAVLRRTIMNNAVLNYAGDAYLLAWSREQTIATKRAIAVVRDVALLSAIVTGVVTLVLAAVSLPVIQLPQSWTGSNMLVASMGIIATATIVTIAIAARLTPLVRSEVMAAIGILLLRTIATTVCIALLWHFALPQVPVTEWMTLAVVRLIFWRLPLVPNKDVAFAATASAVIGGHSSIAAVVTLVAVLTLIVQLAFALFLAVQALSPRKVAR